MSVCLRRCVAYSLQFGNSYSLATGDKRTSAFLCGYKNVAHKIEVLQVGVVIILKSYNSLVDWL